MIDDELAESFNKLFHLKENIQQINRVEPIKIGVEIERKIVSMELDTGASVSIISEYEYRKKFGEIKLETDGLKLQYYTNETVDTLGHIQVNIKYKNKKFKGKWYVLKGQGPMLLGREWLKEMGTLSDLCINKKQLTTQLRKHY